MHPLDLRDARARLKLTQAQLANHTGITTKTVNRYESDCGDVPRVFVLAVRYLLLIQRDNYRRDML